MNRIDKLYDMMESILFTTLPVMEERLIRLIEKKSILAKKHGRIVLFDGLGPPPVASPSIRATYQSRSDGKRWWWTGTKWNSIG